MLHQKILLPGLLHFHIATFTLQLLLIGRSNRIDHVLIGKDDIQVMSDAPSFSGADCILTTTC
jgi:hypothetical protein